MNISNDFLIKDYSNLIEAIKKSTYLSILQNNVNNEALHDLAILVPN